MIRIFETQHSSPDNTERANMPTTGADQHTADEQYAVAQFEANIKMKNDRYYVRPIFKDNFIPMRNNYFLALRRYTHLRSTFQKKQGAASSNDEAGLEAMYCKAM